MAILKICEAMHCCPSTQALTCQHRWTHYASHSGDECTDQSCMCDFRDEERRILYQFAAHCITWYDGIEDELPKTLEEVKIYRERRG